MTDERDVNEGPATHEVSTGGTIDGSGVTQTPPNPDGVVQVGQSLPGKPPHGLPDGPGVDMYGRPLRYADPDPKKRTGDPDEVPPPDPPGFDPYAPGPSAS